MPRRSLAMMTGSTVLLFACAASCAPPPPPPTTPTIQAVATQAQATASTGQTQIAPTVAVVQTQVAPTVAAAGATVAVAATNSSAARQATATVLAPTAQVVATQVAPTLQAAGTQVAGPVGTSVAVSPVHITGVTVSSTDTTVTIQNTGSTPVDLMGWTLVLGPAFYVGLSGLIVPAGQTKTLHFTPGIDTVTDAYMGLGSNALAAALNPGTRVVLISPNLQISSVYSIS